MTSTAIKQHVVFQTTFGFQTTNDCSTSREITGGYSYPTVSSFSLPNNSARKQSSAPAEVNCHVGWKGLLEISQKSGCSGVMGAKEPDDPQSGTKAKIEICCTAHPNTAVRRLVKSVIRGLKACQEPERAADGMGGTYFFANELGKRAAILKPCDEEPLAPNNPKECVGRSLGDPGWKPTVRVGEAALREVAAYLLDHDHFARVPTSVLVRARHPVFCYNYKLPTSVVRSASSSDTVGGAGGAAPQPTGQGGDEGGDGHGHGHGGSREDELPLKLGSLQEYVQHECDTSEMGATLFSSKDVHRIGILDIRLFNTDRHTGNMLVRQAKSGLGSSISDLRKSRVTTSFYDLIPIDHGFCLPENLEAPYFEWMHWPQAMLPFSEDELHYVRDLDIEKDKAILQQELPNLRPECLRVLEVSTTLLQDGCAAGLTLFDIANLISKPFLDREDSPSELEKLCAKAKFLAELRLAAAQYRGSPEDLPEEEDGCSSSGGNRDGDHSGSASDSDSYDMAASIGSARRSSSILAAASSDSGACGLSFRLPPPQPTATATAAGSRISASSLLSDRMSRMGIVEEDDEGKEAAGLDIEANDDMLFDLEDDMTGGGGHGHHGAGHGVVGHGALGSRLEPAGGVTGSPPATVQFSLASSNSSASPFSVGNSSVVSGSGVLGPASPAFVRDKPAAAAHSMNVSGGFMWRKSSSTLMTSVPKRHSIQQVRGGLSMSVTAATGASGGRLSRIQSISASSRPGNDSDCDLDELKGGDSYGSPRVTATATLGMGVAKPFVSVNGFATSAAAPIPSPSTSIKIGGGGGSLFRPSRLDNCERPSPVSRLEVPCLSQEQLGKWFSEADGEAWIVFIGELRKLVKELLDSKSWKLERSTTGAMSCPRF